MNHTEILIHIVKELNIKIMAEIGVFRGRLCRGILRSECRHILKEYWAVDSWEVLGEEHKRMGTYDSNIWDETYKGVCKYMPYFPQMKILKMKSNTASTFFWEGYFDFVYLDASHLYKDVFRDIQLWMPLIKPGGAIGGHDYNSSRHRGVTRAVNKLFNKEDIEIFSNMVWLKRL